MAVPGTVTKRAEGNTFVAETGMVLTGVTGFGIRTGFYLTNSGNYPIETEVGYTASSTPGIFDFPSGKEFTILAGQNKFIPFEMVFVQDNIYGPTTSAQSTGPDTHGLYTTTLTLDTISQFDGQTDPDGIIKVYVTGQVSGFLATANTVNPSSGPTMMRNPAYPSGFLVTTDYASNGKPESVLRWQHPSTGYYLKRYQIDYAGNIEDSSTSTGSWTGLTTFDINYESKTYSGPGLYSAITYQKYGTNTGIAQMYTRGSNPNPPSEYGEHTVSNLGFSANYYYRIKSEYLDRDSEIAYESPYVYGYPVDNFNVDITDSNINAGLLSGSSTLPVAGDPTVIANTTAGPQSLDIYFSKGQKDINLETEFNREISDRGVSVNSFNPAHADYAFSGVHFIVPQDTVVGSKTEGQAGITSGGQIKYGSTEIKTVLNLEKNSMVAGIGGKGGDGGYTDIELIENPPSYFQGDGKFNIKKNSPVESVDGGDGTPAIYINDTSIALLQIKKHPTSRIYGGGGGGGGGDPFFFPKAFTLNPNRKFSFKKTKSNKKNDILYSSIALNEEGVKDFTFEGMASVNLYEGGDTKKERVTLSYNLSDILGTQLAGGGGGGQGASSIPGGASLKTKTGTVTAVFKSGEGGIEGMGYGSSADSNNKISPAGNGGVFGKDGENALNVNAAMVFNTVQDSPARQGGAGGEGIKIITGNSNYAALGNLVQNKGALEPTTSNFPSLLAWFTTEDPSKITTVTSGGWKYVSNWEAKNDSSIDIVFPRTGWAAGNRPVFIDADATGDANYNQYPAFTKAFNYTDVVHFGLTNATAGEITGLVKSGKLEMDMPGFEIVYFLYPGTLRATNAAGALTYSHNWHLSAFRLFQQNNSRLPRSKAFNTGAQSYSTRQVGWGLHQWTYGPDSLFYYTKDNKNWSSENAGLLNYKQATFRDFTNGVSPERAWMYSISAFRNGTKMDYRIYNDLNQVYKTNFILNKFKWLPKPLIGANSGTSTAPSSQYTSFFGCVSDILVFKKALTTAERASVFGHLANTKLRIPTVRHYTVTAYSAVYRASFNPIRIYFTSLPEYVFAGRKVVFSNGAIFTFTSDSVKNAGTVQAHGTLTADINGHSGTLYPGEDNRNTLELQNGYAGF
ncbi:MAG: hypothetical protein VX617_02370, partial [Pseudomonadota bacterium]|nr:hypothetical protein [Pseudomonadota bacterium]